MDKNSNSLKQLNSYLGTMGKLAKENEDKITWNQQGMPSDSITIIQSPDAAY
jgi:hypothetical protein